MCMDKLVAELLKLLNEMLAGQERLLEETRATIGSHAMPAARAVLLAVAAADYCLLDEMRPTFDDDYPWSDGAAPYHRFQF